jgi:putative ABC transport system permease protein
MMLIRTLLKHYRRHPVQGLFLLVGIVVANVLLAGTLVINAQARASYGQGEQFLSAAPAGQLRHREPRRSIDTEDYVRLRLAGFDMLAPLQRQTVRAANGELLELLGIDVFTMPRPGGMLPDGRGDQNRDPGFLEFAYPPYQLWVASGRLNQLDLKEGDRIVLSSGELLPPLAAIRGQQLGHRMLTDIGALQALSGNPATLSAILVFPASAERLAELSANLPEHLEFIRSDDAPDPQELTRSFHLNLAAMGLMAFVVGVFLIYNALAFSYTDRRELIRKLRLAGVTRRELALALVSELVLFLAAGTVLGYWLGAQLAAWLLPGVGRTLAQLYDVYIAYPDSLVPSAILLPLLMTGVAAALCMLIPLRESLNTPMLERWQTRWQHQVISQRERVMSVAGLMLLGTSAILAYYTSDLWLALTGMAALLLGAVLLLPTVLRMLFNLFAKCIPAHRVRLSWLLADSRWLLGPASLALMAMTLALVANSGLNTMINSFRLATDQWLDQRLAADLYLRGGTEMTDIGALLAREAPGLRVAERYHRRITRQGSSERIVPVEIVSLQDGDRFTNSVELMGADENARIEFENGEGIYISERAWRIDGWQPGESVRLCQTHGQLPVLGVYRDYGNPSSQWMVSRELFRSCWPGEAAAGFAVYGPDGTDWNQIKAVISNHFNLPEGRIIDQHALKQAGLAVFDRTFKVTRSLNALTLLVAGIGIFCAISAIHHHRVGQQALLAALGITRRERGALLLLQWSVLGLLCMLLVWPFGGLLAGYLANVVTPVAFGWSFPLDWNFHQNAVLAALAIGSMTLAVVLPTLRLLRISPAAMLREQTTI